MIPAGVGGGLVEWVGPTDGFGFAEVVAVGDGFGVLPAVGLAGLGGAEELAGAPDDGGVLSGTAVGLTLGAGDTLTGVGVLTARLVLGSAGTGRLALLPWLVQPAMVARATRPPTAVFLRESLIVPSPPSLV